MTIDYSAVTALAAQLGTIPVSNQAKMAAEVARAADQIETAAKGAAPVGPTHNLRDSISTIVYGPLSRTVVAEAEYSKFQEFGTGKMDAQPFMYPAADGMEVTFYDNVLRIMSEGLD